LIRAVVGIIKNADKILVGQRPLGKPYAGYWEFPGGKVEANETSLDALKRELEEELGIQVSEASHWFEYTHTYPDKTVTLEMWQVTEYQGLPQSRESQILKWVDQKELFELSILEGNKSILEKIPTIF
jgi:8-oxo-dGTP diphosphatase